jgi:hypothetical protein
MPGPRVNQVGTSAGGAGDRLVCLRPVIEAGIFGPALNAKSQRWALVEKDDCHRIVPHLRGALELHGFHVRTGSAEENLKIRQIPQMRDRAHVPQDGTTLRTGQARGRTFFHAGCYRRPSAGGHSGNLRRHAGPAGPLREGNNCGAPDSKGMSPAVGGRRGSLNRDAVVAMGFTAPGTSWIFAADG